jgi:hypothetical protein
MIILNFNIEEVLKSKAFANIEPELILLLKKLMQQIQGKTPAESVPVIITFMTTLPRHLSITKQQESEILNSVMQHLSTSEQTKIKALMKVMGMNK